MTEDDHQGALNSGETAGCPPLPAGELAENLRKLMLTMYAENISPDGKVGDDPGVEIRGQMLR